MRSSQLKNSVLRPAKKLGIVIVPDSKADQLLSAGSQKAARLVTQSQRRLRALQTASAEAVEDLRARLHAATAPQPPRARTKTPRRPR